jgi:hypothetical protein
MPCRIYLLTLITFPKFKSNTASHQIEANFKFLRAPLTMNTPPGEKPEDSSAAQFVGAALKHLGFFLSRCLSEGVTEA